MARPDSTATDEQLWEMTLAEVAREATTVEARPGVILVDLPGPEPGAPRRVEIRMTSCQLRESVTSLSADGQEALGITDPVTAGWALFTIHLEEHLRTLRPGESFLLWHEGALHPAVDLAWPPVRARLRDLPKPAPGVRWEWRAEP